MSFIVTDRMGSDRRDPPEVFRAEVPSDLENADAEQFEILLQRENGWCLSSFGRGLLAPARGEDS